MPRSTSFEIEEAVNKATDENLTSENWEYILEVCDKVNETPYEGPIAAVASLQKRLAHRSANVQIYTLTLTGSLAQNCGVEMHRQLVTPSFTQSLLRVATDRTVHNTVRSKVIEVMEEMVKLFRGNSALSSMADALAQLNSAYPRLHAPDKPERPPVHKSATLEDEELQMVLALSLREKEEEDERAQKTRQSEIEEKERASLVNTDGPAAGPSKPANAAKTTTSRVRALYDLTPTEPGELAFKRGDIIFVLESVYQDWWKGSLRGQVGIFPLNYVTPIPDPTPESMQEEAEQEAKVMAEGGKIEKLLALLSAPDGSADIDSAELENLYRSAMSVRPTLVKLIDRYATRKDEMLDLNERFVAATTKYDNFINTYIGQYRSPTLTPAAPYMPASAAPVPLIPTSPDPSPSRIANRNSYTPSIAAPPPPVNSSNPFTQPSFSQSHSLYPQQADAAVQMPYPQAKSPYAPSFLAPSAPYAQQPPFSQQTSRLPYPLGAGQLPHLPQSDQPPTYSQQNNQKTYSSPLQAPLVPSAPGTYQPAASTSPSAFASSPPSSAAFPSAMLYSGNGRQKVYEPDDSVISAPNANDLFEGYPSLQSMKGSNP
ncbi:hypothetical protein V1512DRAFT_132989 [Lipomyces arxii]|uniref:uncharacterized protein n=1 Tax=Lipomyces arxii TaxID=56418 RepID=UPI0034CDB853